MPKLVIMLGIMGAGKTSHVNKYLIPRGFQVVCADDYRLAYGHKFYHEIEPQVHASVRMNVLALMKRKVNIVVDACHVDWEFVNQWVKLCEVNGYEFEVHHIDTPTKICRERRSKDPDFPLDVLTKAAQKLTHHAQVIRNKVGYENFLIYKGYTQE